VPPDEPAADVVPRRLVGFAAEDLPALSRFEKVQTREAGASLPLEMVELTAFARLAREGGVSLAVISKLLRATRTSCCTRAAFTRRRRGSRVGLDRLTSSPIRKVRPSPSTAWPVVELTT
jgi:hypothetical protein